MRTCSASGYSASGRRAPAFPLGVAPLPHVFPCPHCILHSRPTVHRRPGRRDSLMSRVSGATSNTAKASGASTDRARTTAPGTSPAGTARPSASRARTGRQRRAAPGPSSGGPISPGPGPPGPGESSRGSGRRRPRPARPGRPGSAPAGAGPAKPDQENRSGCASLLSPTGLGRKGQEGRFFIGPGTKNIPSFARPSGTVNPCCCFSSRDAPSPAGESASASDSRAVEGSSRPSRTPHSCRGLRSASPRAGRRSSWSREASCPPSDPRPRRPGRHRSL